MSIATYTKGIDCFTASDRLMYVIMVALIYQKPGSEPYLDRRQKCDRQFCRSRVMCKDGSRRCNSSSDGITRGDIVLGWK